MFVGLFALVGRVRGFLHKPGNTVAAGLVSYGLSCDNDRHNGSLKNDTSACGKQVGLSQTLALRGSFCVRVYPDVYILSLPCPFLRLAQQSGWRGCPRTILPKLRSYGVKLAATCRAGTLLWLRTRFRASPRVFAGWVVS